MNFFETKLSNGLTILGEERPTAVSVAIGYFVRTGSRDETPEIAGCSHFLEHMMFKGTATRSALDINFDLGRIGAQANAFTSEENTVYYMAILPEYFESGLELLSDMLRPALDEKEFSTEKNVILEEIALYHDRPTHVLFETSMREFFNGHPAGNSVLGSIDSVRGISRDMMKGYFDRRYSPSNITLVAAGQFDWKKLVALAEQYTSTWPKVAADRKTPAHAPVAKQRTLTKANLQASHLVLATLGPSAQDDYRYAAEVLCCILGDGSGSRTYWELVDKGLADAAFIDLDDMDETGVVFGYVSSYPAQLDKVGEILEGILKTPMEFSDADLDRAKTKIGTRLVLKGESSMQRLMAVGLNWVYRKEYETLAEELKAIQAVTRSDIGRMLEKYPLTPLTSVKLIPA